MNSIGSAAGYCQIHKMDKMFVGLEDATEPTCVRCVADATPKLGRTQTVQDPGEAFFTKGGKSDAKVELLETQIDVADVAKNFAGVASASNRQYTVRDVVDIAVGQLRKLPMPEDIKEFKRVQKVIKTLQSLVENQNG